MKITKSQLQRIIQEELQQIMSEQAPPYRAGQLIQREEPANTLELPPATGLPPREPRELTPLQQKALERTRPLMRQSVHDAAAERGRMAARVDLGTSTPRFPDRYRAGAHDQRRERYQTGPPPADAPRGGQLPQVTRESLINDIAESVLAKLTKR